MIRGKATCEEEMGEHNVAQNKRAQEARLQEERKTQVVDADDDSFL